MKKLWTAAAVAGLLMIPAAALAMGTVTGSSVTVPAGQTRTGTYFAAGSVVTMAGTIDGDFVCAGSNVTITGTVHGDVLCAGQIVDIAGTVDGSVRAAGQTITLEGAVGRNVMVFGQDVTTKATWQVAGDAGVFAQFAKTDGKVAKDIYGGVQNLTLGGESNAVSVMVNQLTLSDSAKINGNLWYSAKSASSFDHSRIAGDVNYSKLNPQPSPESAAVAGILWRLYWLSASLVTALVLFSLFPHRIRRLTDVMLERPGRSIGWGAVTVLAAPMALFLIAITVVGLPLALVGGAALGAAVYFAPILAGTAASIWLLHRFNYRTVSIWWAGLLGIIVMTAVIWTPFLGAIVWTLATMWTLGGVMQAARSGRVKSSTTV